MIVDEKEIVPATGLLHAVLCLLQSQILFPCLLHRLWSDVLRMKLVCI